MHAEPTPEHLWLRKFLGEWTFTSEAKMEPDGEPMRFSGTESFRAIGDRWVVGEMRGEMPDGGTATLMTSIGFSETRGRFVGTFFGSPEGHLWIYDGGLDKANDEPTLEAEGPSLTEPGLLRQYRDITRFVSDDERQFRSELFGHDGIWRPFMRATFARRA